MEKRIVIVGGGRIGYYLVKSLSRRRHNIVVIENDKDICKSVADALDIPVIWGDGSSCEAMENAGIDGADIFIAVTGRDEVNLIACQTAKMVYNVPKTAAKANDPKNVENMKKLGVDVVISSTESILKQMEREVKYGSVIELMTLDDNRTALYEIDIPEDFPFSGQELSDITLPSSCNVVSINRGGQLIIPHGKTKLLSGDRIIIVAENTVLNEIKKDLRLKK